MRNIANFCEIWLMSRNGLSLMREDTSSLCFSIQYLGVVAIEMSIDVSVAGKRLIDAVVNKSGDTIFLFGASALDSSTEKRCLRI